MPNDSTTAGYLTPVAPLPIYDDALVDALQATITGITGNTGSLIRPRWQPEPVTKPDSSVNWVAFGITNLEPDTFPFEEMAPDGQTMTVQYSETLQVLHSFYGPAASAMASRFRTGLMVSQNRDPLRAAGILLVAAEKLVNLPALFKEKWVQRVDLTVYYRRVVSHTYQIRSVVSAGAGLDNELYVTPIPVPTPPTP